MQCCLAIVCGRVGSVNCDTNIQTLATATFQESKFITLNTKISHFYPYPHTLGTLLRQVQTSDLSLSTSSQSNQYKHSSGFSLHTQTFTEFLQREGLLQPSLSRHRERGLLFFSSLQSNGAGSVFRPQVQSKLHHPTLARHVPIRLHPKTRRPFTQHPRSHPSLA